MSYVDEVLELVKKKNASEPEFIQAVTEVLNSLRPVVEANVPGAPAAATSSIERRERLFHCPKRSPPPAPASVYWAILLYPRPLVNGGRFNSTVH